MDLPEVPMRRFSLLLALLAPTACVPHLVSSNRVDPADWVAPENGWPVSDTLPPADTDCGGFDPGDTLCDLRLMDQYGDEVSLWQFWGDVVLLDLSTMWCSPCQELAKSTQETFERFEPQGFMYLSVLQQDIESNPPDLADVQEWAEVFGIEAPVLADGDLRTGDAVRNGVYPVLLLLDRDMRVHDRVEPPQQEVLDAAIEALIGG